MRASRSTLIVADYSDRMNLRLFGLSSVLLASCLSAAPAAQRPARSIAGVLEALDRVRAFHETAISPDGRRVAWVEDVSVADGTTAIYMRTLGAPAEAKPLRITASTDGRGHDERGIAWAPDSHTIAFLSDSES